MPSQTRILTQGPEANTFRTPTGELLRAPAGWLALPPGDPGLTRRVKSAGPTWLVQEKRGRKLFSRGLWAPRQHIDDARAQLKVERAEPAYEKKQAAAAVKRQREQEAYVYDFAAAVVVFLAFAQRYTPIAIALAVRVTQHATPVGSGTVARTERIPLPERAEAAVFAWMRHQTTAYDDMHIARVKGLRREVRRELAQRSRQLLEAYRRGVDVDPSRCPLQCALAKEPTPDC